MLKQFEKQKAEIKFENLSGTLRQKYSIDFDKMILESGGNLKRSDIVFSRLKFQKVDRKVYELESPLYTNIAEDVESLRKLSNSNDEKVLIPSSIGLIEKVINNHKKVPRELTVNQYSKDLLKFPLDLKGDQVSDKQQFYFSRSTYQIVDCDCCYGHGLIECDDPICGGRHNWVCETCDGDKTVSCSVCGSDGKVTCSDCRGNGRIKCGSMLGSGLVSGLGGGSMAGCNGKGRITTTAGKYANGQPKYVEKQCSKCRGAGDVGCTTCRQKGEVTCSNCAGRGNVRCDDCSGKGDKTCTKCYGDKARYGKIDCPKCDTTGKLVRFVYIQTTVSNGTNDLFVAQGDDISIDQSVLLEHVRTLPPGQLIYQYANKEILNLSHEYYDFFVESHEGDLGLSRKEFPMVTSEQLEIKCIPCIEFEYTHILSGLTFSAQLIDFWDAPQLVLLGDPEKLKISVGSSSQTLGNFFARLFGTKKYKSKEDRKKEIQLMIYLAKIDGQIIEEEKRYLSELVGGVSEFTNADKKAMFNLLNTADLPELKDKELKFSSKTVAEEVLARLMELAASDGNIDPAEKQKIDEWGDRIFVINKK
ncbi:MAG: hypothetical protein RIT42_309 [Bacteroidota bacterium]|jgi:hypothetical protein